MKTLLPWLCVLGLAAGLGWLYSADKKKDADMAVLREDSQQLQQVKAELEQVKAAGAQAATDELTRLRKEHDELLRLRNEARQLRTDKQQLSAQAQTAQVQAQRAQAQVQTLQANPAQPGAPAATDAAARAAFEARYGLTSQNTQQAQVNACINNLRMIDGAKQQWALEKQKGPNAMPTAADLSPYLRSNTLPVCPAGGVYTLNPVYLAPLCNIPGHALPK
jgi:hypothetical protein